MIQKNEDLLNVKVKSNYNMIRFLFTCIIAGFSVCCGHTQISDNDTDKKPLFGISLHSGLFLINGDIDGAGQGAGVRIQFPANTIFSVRANAYFASGKGVGVQAYQHSSFGGGLVESVFEPYRNVKDGWYPSYQYQQVVVEMEGLLNVLKLINKIYDMEFEYMDLYILGSLGLFGKQTRLDMVDSQNLPYTNLLSKVGSGLDIATSKGRNQIRKNVRSVYDGDYETEIQYPGNITYSFGGGFAFNLNKSISVGFEHKFIFYPDVDYIDGIRFRTSLDQPLSEDKASYSNLFLMIKI